MTPEKLLHMEEVVQRAIKTLEDQQAQIGSLNERNSLLETGISFLSKYVRAVEDHNAECDQRCNAGSGCGYEGYLKRTGRRCATCPVEYKIDVVPTKGNA